jgi:acetyl-CoA C-acetyltransferase
MDQNDPIAIVAARRTALGSFNGTLAHVPAPELGHVVLDAIIKDAGLQPSDIDDVIMGQVLTGGVGMNPARQTAIMAGIPQDKTALTVNQVCGSGLRSVALGMQAILTGDSNIVIAGGQENMSLAPHVAHLRNGTKMGDMSHIDSMIRDGLWDVFNGYHMGVTAENVATAYHISRADQDEFAATSQQRTEAAMKTGKFTSEIVPVKIKVKKEEITFSVDEFPRAGTTVEKLAGLKPAFKPDGTVTAGNASGINDGAAAVVLMRLSEAKKRNIKPFAIIKSWATAGVDPAVMGTGPIPASRKALAKAGWNVADLDLVESNEAFAAQAIAVTRDLGLDPAKTNVNGGAIAIGHPIGASGTRVLVTLLHEMARRGSKRGLATLCIGGGMGIALCVERAGDIEFRTVI